MLEQRRQIKRDNWQYTRDPNASHKSVLSDLVAMKRNDIVRSNDPVFYQPWRKQSPVNTRSDTDLVDPVQRSNESMAYMYENPTSLFETDLLQAHIPAPYARRISMQYDRYRQDSELVHMEARTMFNRDVERDGDPPTYNMMKRMNPPFVANPQGAGGRDQKYAQISSHNPVIVDYDTYANSSHNPTHSRRTRRPYSHNSFFGNLGGGLKMLGKMSYHTIRNAKNPDFFKTVKAGLPGSHNAIYDPQGIYKEKNKRIGKVMSEGLKRFKGFNRSHNPYNMTKWGAYGSPQYVQKVGGVSRNKLAQLTHNPFMSKFMIGKAYKHLPKSVKNKLKEKGMDYASKILGLASHNGFWGSLRRGLGRVIQGTGGVARAVGKQVERGGKAIVGKGHNPSWVESDLPDHFMSGLRTPRSMRKRPFQETARSHNPVTLRTPWRNPFWISQKEIQQGGERYIKQRGAQEYLNYFTSHNPYEGRPY